jgi:hypothetical protein
MLKEWFSFRFKPTVETAYAFGVGVIVIVLSVMMNAVNMYISFLLRDVLMIAGCGVYFVLWRIHKQELSEYGLSLFKWKRDLIVNLSLAVALAFLMVPSLLASGKTFVAMNMDTLSRMLFIMLAGIFEVMLFYTYQRVAFEKAFGKIPAIILCAAFYSLHHAGFQPEFLKLFFVGVSFVLVVAITNSVWSIFPFYWAVGALLDVLVQSEVVSPIQYPLFRSIVIIILMVVAIVLFYVRKRKENKTAEAS